MYPSSSEACPCGEHVIDAVEHVFFVAVVVDNAEFRPIEEATGIQAVGGDEVSPILAAVGEVAVHIRRSEGAVRGGHVAVRRSRPSPERVVTSMTRLVLSPYSAEGARRSPHRLHGVERNLVGEHLALLVGDGLAIERKRVFRVIAQSVKQAVGIGSHPGDAR